MYLLRICSLFLLYNFANCGVWILSTRKIEVSSLQKFTEETYQFIKKSSGGSKVVTFHLNSDYIPEECAYLLDQKYSTYVPTVDYIPENAIALNSSPKRNCEEIKQRIKKIDMENTKTVQLLIHNPIRRKREIESSTAFSTLPSNITERLFKERVAVSPDEPVLYNARGKALLYSSHGLVLRIPDEPDLILGPTKLVTTDSRETYTRLIATVPVNEGKILLRFRFPWVNGYWSLGSVEVVDLNGKTYNLSINSEVLAPRNFSHRCGGETVFTNGTVSLTLFDLQVQPDTDNGFFSDAYNCVPFTTGPIWSGLFVTSILMTGLTIGLLALGSIKTMDKFDNSKTKQLTITLMGE